MTPAAALLLASYVALVGGFVIIGMSTTKNPLERRPGDRTEDDVVGIGIGCALMLAALVIIGAFAGTWLIDHVRII